MNGDEPEVGHAGLQHRIDAGISLEPVQESVHFGEQTICLWRFEMDVLLSNRAGHDLHRSCAAVSPGPCPNFCHAAAAGGKQRGMPCEQAFGGERLVIVARSIKHHFDDTLNVAVRGPEGADVHTQTPGNR